MLNRDDTVSRGGSYRLFPIWSPIFVPFPNAKSIANRHHITKVYEMQDSFALHA